MPYGLALAFNEELRVEADLNQLQDGWAIRRPLVIFERHFFKLTRPLTAEQWTELRDFYMGHIAEPFWFYNLRETVPPWTWDPTGVSPDGRYTVVFDGAWSEDIRLPRSTCSFGLREVA